MGKDVSCECGGWTMYPVNISLQYESWVIFMIQISP